MLNPNAAYWNNFYSNVHELPLEPSDFAFYTVKFLQGLAEKNSYKNILDIGCGNGRDSYFLSSQGYTVTGIDSCSKIEVDKFQFLQKNILDYEFDGFDVYYLRFVIHALTESECVHLFARLALMPPKTLIAFETRSTTNITEEEKSETFFKSPIGEDGYFGEQNLNECFHQKNYFYIYWFRFINFMFEIK
jgi:SAM-dependent methyltransferase